MILHELDNPLWSSLSGPHASLAGTHGDTRWYPAAVAPFIAIPRADVVPSLSEAAARGVGFPAYFLGVIPRRLPAGFQLEDRGTIVQLTPGRTEPAAAVAADAARDARDDIGDVVGLGSADHAAMIGLASVAFPDYFRASTPILGAYFGIRREERLVAMAGERMATPGFREISAVCTHPDFAGRGYAHRLTRTLLARHQRLGVRSFLHASESNPAARRLYASLGFVERTRLRLAVVRNRA